MNGQTITVLVLSIIIILVTIPACVYIISTQFNTKSTYQNNYYSIFDKSSKHEKYYLLQGNRTDMLGSYSQGFIVTIITLLSDKSNNYNIIINKTPKLFDDWSHYEELDPEKMQDPHSKIFQHNMLLILGNESKESHKNARKTMMNILFPHKVNKKVKDIERINVENTELQIKPGMLQNSNVKKFTRSIRHKFKKFLPKSFANEEFIAIHYRAGDVLNYKNRFIHSSKYASFCKYLKDTFPSLKIYVFTSKKPEPETDDLSTFKKFANNIFEADDYATIECWAIFMHCKIFVMSRSCMSVSTALLRDIYSITYYGTKERPLPDKNWKYWMTPNK